MLKVMSNQQRRSATAVARARERQASMPVEADCTETQQMLEDSGDRVCVRQEGRFSTELEKLCSTYFEQSMSFAINFVKLAGVRSEESSELEGMIMERVSQVIAKAKLAALETRKPSS